MPLRPVPNQKHREDVEKEELATEEEHIGAEAELRGDGSIRWAAGRRSIGSSRRRMCEDSRTPHGRTGYLFFINIESEINKEKHYRRHVHYSGLVVKAADSCERSEVRISVAVFCFAFCE